MSAAIHKNIQITSTANISRRRSATISTSAPIFDFKKDASNVVSVSVSVQDSLSSIPKWASQVAPGSPPAPSPRSSSFYGSFTPLTSRRFSSFLGTPSPKPVSPSDLLAQGYTSFVVHLPSLESPSPSGFVRKSSPAQTSQARQRTKSLSEEKSKPLSRLRSLSFKTKQSNSAMPSIKAIPPVPPLPAHGRARSSSKSKVKSTPQARYGALIAPGNGAGALPLAQEIALSQMLDGGSHDANVRRVQERHTRDSHGERKKRSAKDEVFASHGVRRGEEAKDRRPVEKREREQAREKGVGAVYKDADGRMWCDEDEALELTGLLPSPTPLGASNAQNIGAKEKDTKRRGLFPRIITASSKPVPTAPLPAAPDWVSLHSPSALSPSSPGADGADRRGSANSDASRDSELDAAFAVRPRESIALSGAGPGPALFAGYSLDVAPHLRRPAPGIEAFGGVSPLDVSGAPTSHAARDHRRERRRPAPLTLPLPTPNSPSSSASTASRPPTAALSTSKSIKHLPPLELSHPMQPTRAEREGRYEYFASSFDPAPAKKRADASQYPHQQYQQAPPSMQSIKAARRSSITAGLSALVSKGSRRASVASASPTSPMGFAIAQQRRPDGSVVHLPYHATGPARPSTSSGADVGSSRTLRNRPSRSRLANLFKRG